MADVRRKAEQDRNWLEKLLHRVPGFRGYLEKEERRETDRLLREHLAASIDRINKRLAPAMRDLADNGDLKLTGNIDRARGMLERLAGQVRYVSYGYSGLFDAVKVREAELDRLYAFDVALVDQIDRLEAAVTDVLNTIAKHEDATPKVRQVEALARAFDESLDGRTQLLTQPADEPLGRR